MQFGFYLSPVQSSKLIYPGSQEGRAETKSPLFFLGKGFSEVRAEARKNGSFHIQVSFLEPESRVSSKIECTFAQFYPLLQFITRFV